MLADVKLHWWASHLSRCCTNVRTKGRPLVREVLGIGEQLKAKLKEKFKKE